MGMECGATTPSGPTQSRALRLVNNKREYLRSARCRHEAFSSSPHIHTQRRTLAPLPLPVPTYWSRLLLLAACHLRKKCTVSFSRLSSLPTPSLPRCRRAAGGSGDDMRSVKRAPGKSDYRPPHILSNESFLRHNPEKKIIIHSNAVSIHLGRGRWCPCSIPLLDGLSASLCLCMCVCVWLSCAAVMIRLLIKIQKNLKNRS